MIAIHAGLVGPAEAAGIPVPEDPENYMPEEFMLWHVFCNIQLGAPMPSPTSHWENAQVIAKLSLGEARIITVRELVQRGFQIADFDHEEFEEGLPRHYRVMRWVWERFPRDFPDTRQAWFESGIPVDEVKEMFEQFGIECEPDSEEATSYGVIAGWVIAHARRCIDLEELDELMNMDESYVRGMYTKMRGDFAVIGVKVPALPE